MGKKFNHLTKLKVNKVQMGTTWLWETWPFTLLVRTRMWPLAAECHTTEAFMSWISTLISPVSGESKATMTRRIFLSCRTGFATYVNQISVLIWVSHTVKPKDYLLFLHRSPFCSTFCPAIPLPKHSSDSLLWRGEFLPGGSVCVLAPKWHSPTWTPRHWAEPGWDLQNQTLLHFEHRAEGPRWEGGVCCEPTRGRASSQRLCIPGDTGSPRWNWIYDRTYETRLSAFTSVKQTQYSSQAIKKKKQWAV